MLPLQAVETDQPDDEPKEPRAEGEPLPESVVRALADARAAAARAGKSRVPEADTRSARWLAVIPLAAAALAMVLVMPRATPPDDIPLPEIDAKALEAVRADDTARAASARVVRLSGDLLEVGTALREVNRAQVTGGDADEVGRAQLALQHAFETVAADREKGADALRSLRAVQLEAFLAEAARFDATGQPSEELELLSGPFLDHMALAGWVDHGKLVLDEPARRAPTSWCGTPSSAPIA